MNRLSPELLEVLAERGDARTFARGETIICEGDVSDSLFILLSGQLKVFSRDPKGREVVYNILDPGELFGEMFLDGGRRSASVNALVRSECIVVNGQDIRRFLHMYSEFAECLVMKLIARLRHATSQIKSLALHGVYERTVSLLNELSVQDEEVQYVPASITQQEIANRIGATREMVNHVLRDLVRGGFLAKKDAHSRLVILKELPKSW